jgi:hypothetical protein
MYREWRALCLHVVGAGPRKESRDCAHRGARGHKACVQRCGQLEGHTMQAWPLGHARQARLARSCWCIGPDKCDPILSCPYGVVKGVALFVES